MLVTDHIRKSLFVPYTILGYLITQKEETCTYSHNFYHHQLKNSRLLNTAGTRDRKMFFNRIYQKIDFYTSQMQSLIEYH